MTPVWRNGQFGDTSIDMLNAILSSAELAGADGPNGRCHQQGTTLIAARLPESRRVGPGILSRREIRRGSFASTSQLIARIDTFVTHYNSTARPLIWTATADEILRKVAAICKVINGTRH